MVVRLCCWSESHWVGTLLSREPQTRCLTTCWRWRQMKMVGGNIGDGSVPIMTSLHSLFLPFPLPSSPPSSPSPPFPLPPSPILSPDTFAPDFFLTYSSFMSTQRLCDGLMKRYHSQVDKNGEVPNASPEQETTRKKRWGLLPSKPPAGTYMELP